MVEMALKDLAEKQVVNLDDAGLAELLALFRPYMVQPEWAEQMRDEIRRRLAAPISPRRRAYSGGPDAHSSE